MSYRAAKDRALIMLARSQVPVYDEDGWRFLEVPGKPIEAFRQPNSASRMIPENQPGYRTEEL